MHRAIQLAKNGLGDVSPNPMVGCVIVFEDRIIGEGWHKKYGDPHAEVEAIRSVQKKENLKKSTLYVSLEPCVHFGKTPPCSDLIINCGIKKVVIACKDINPKVSGKGIKVLQENKIEVIFGVLENQAKKLNSRFFTFFKKKRPYIILKWAESQDGFIADKNYNSKWISSSLSRTLVHKWRSQNAGIMIGTNTAKYDNPNLNVRDWVGKNPVRIIIDNKLSLPGGLNIFDKSIETLRYNFLLSKQEQNLYWIKLPRQDALSNLLYDLYQRKIQSIILEGGAALHQSFVEGGFWDEARVFVSNKILGDGIKAIKLYQNPDFEELVGGDKLLYYKNKS